MGSVCELPSFIDAFCGSSVGFGWATQGQTETCPEATSVLSWQYVLAQHRTETYIRSRFLKVGGADFLQRCHSFILPSILASFPVPAAEKHPYSMTLLHPGDGISQVISGVWSLRWIRLRVLFKGFNFCITRQENLILHSPRVFQMPFCNLRAGCHITFTQSDFDLYMNRPNRLNRLKSQL